MFARRILSLIRNKIFLILISDASWNNIYYAFEIRSLHVRLIFSYLVRPLHTTNCVHTETGFFMSLQLHSVLVCLVLEERNARSFNFEDDNEDEAEDKMVSIAITGAQTKRAVVLSWRERGTQPRTDVVPGNVSCLFYRISRTVFLYSAIIDFYYNFRIYNFR